MGTIVLGSDLTGTLVGSGFRILAEWHMKGSHD